MEQPAPESGLSSEEIFLETLLWAMGILAFELIVELLPQFYSIQPVLKQKFLH